jgi:outer membrane receptor protein involved in Fe transport
MDLQRPDWSGRATASYGYGGFSVDYTVSYLGKMALRGVEIETIDAQFGPAGLTGETWMHNISASYEIADMGMQVFGGITNLSDVKPFITERAYPASPIGRSFFIGARWTM